MIIDNLVSIIMPNYNGAKYLEEAIKSVLAQSYPQWELLIIDDRSNDASREIVSRIAEHDMRVKLLRNEGAKGQAFARNTGINMAKGRYIAFLDSDDIWYEHKLMKQINFMSENSAVMSYCWYDQIDEDGNKLAPVMNLEKIKTYKMLLNKPAIGHSTAMYDRKYCGTVLMPEVLRSDDYGLWLRILKHYGNGHCLHEKLACYRVRNSSVSSNKLKSAAAVWNILRNIEKLEFSKAAWHFANYAIYGVRKKFFAGV